MKRSRFSQRVIGACLGVASLGGIGLVHATSRDVVAKVGSYELRRDEVHKRLNSVPLFQLQNMGETPDEIRERFVSELVGLEVLVQGARVKELHELPDVRQRIQSLLVSALLNDMAKEAASEGFVSDDAVAAYYEANKKRYTQQNRIMIWQITLASKADAEKILTTIKTGSDFQDDASFVTAWEELARTHSLDKTTGMQKGSLGFVQPDGTTAHKDLRVPRELYDAAATIKDGEVYPKPFQVGEYWLVLSRRGSHTTPLRTLESETPNIRGLLARQLIGKNRTALVERLRAEHLHEKNERALDQLTDSDNEISVARRPGALREARVPDGNVKPVGKPGNLR